MIFWPKPTRGQGLAGREAAADQFDDFWILREFAVIEFVV